MLKMLLVLLTKDFIKNAVIFIGLTLIFFFTLIMWVDAAQIEEKGRLDANEKYFKMMQH